MPPASIPGALLGSFRVVCASRDPSRLAIERSANGPGPRDAISDARAQWKDPALSFVVLLARFAFATGFLWAALVAAALVAATLAGLPRPQTLRFVLGSAFAAAAFGMLVAIATSLAAGSLCALVATFLGLAATLLTVPRPGWFTHSGQLDHLGYFTTAFTVAAAAASAGAWLERARRTGRSARPEPDPGRRGNLAIVGVLCFAWALLVYWLSQQTALFKGFAVAVLILLPFLLLFFWRISLDDHNMRWEPAARAAAPLLALLGAAGYGPTLVKDIVEGCNTGGLRLRAVCDAPESVIRDGAAVGALAGLCIAATFVVVELVVPRTRHAELVASAATVGFWLLVLNVHWAFVNLDHEERWVTVAGAAAGMLVGHLCMLFVMGTAGRRRAAPNEQAAV